MLLDLLVSTFSWTNFPKGHLNTIDLQDGNTDNSEENSPESEEDPDLDSPTTELPPLGDGGWPGKSPEEEGRRDRSPPATTTPSPKTR